MTEPIEWFIGDDVPVTASVADAALDPESANTITVAVTDPSGAACTVSTPAAVSTGNYQAIVTTTPLGGVYSVSWTAVVNGVQKSWRYTFTVQSGLPAFPPFASVNDLAARWRPLTAAEQVTARALLNDASALLRARFPGISGQVGGSVDPAALVAVTVGMVKRAMIAPADGVTSQSQAVGPFTQSQTYANPLGNVFLTAADLVLILGYQPSGGSHCFANDTTQFAGSGGGVELVYDTLTVLGP